MILMNVIRFVRFIIIRTINIIHNSYLPCTKYKVIRAVEYRLFIWYIYLFRLVLPYFQKNISFRWTKYKHKKRKLVRVYLILIWLLSLF